MRNAIIFDAIVVACRLSLRNVWTKDEGSDPCHKALLSILESLAELRIVLASVLLF